jgi:hypothetical protein
MLGMVRAENSWDAASHYADSSLDMVFLDADHEYNSIAKDIDAWRPKVKRRGILAGHDYVVGFGVPRAVNERFARFEVWPGSLYDNAYFPTWSVSV